MTYDLAIIGGGPAAVAAGVYAARKQLKSLFITESWGGQSVVSDAIQNWIGTVSISGNDFSGALKKHLESYAGDILEIKAGERVQKIEKVKNGFSVTTAKNSYEAKTIFIATGSTRRKLEIPGAKEYDNKGLSYCASCDGPLYGGQDVVIIGGGNAAFESAAQLLAYCKSVTILNRSDKFRADPVTVKKVLSHPNMKALMNVEPVEVKGDKFVNGLVYKDVKTGKITEMKAGGVFVEIGLIPSTSLAEGVVKMNEIKQIVVNPRTQETSIKGIWAAGDCTDGLYHQNNIAAGDAVKALEDIYLHLHAK